MTTVIILGILFVLGICATFLIFPRKSQHQIELDDAEEAAYWTKYAELQNILERNQRRSNVKRKFPDSGIVHDFVSRDERINK